METVRSKDGTAIAYERSGAGPALVLVHGTTSAHERWAPLLPMLEPTFTVYAVDRRGRGQSGDSADYSLESEYEDIAAVVDSIVKPASLLGHSYGALICLEAALRVTNLDRLILYEPPIPTGVPIYPPGARAKIQNLLDAGDREGVLLAFYRDVVEIPEPQIAIMRKEPAWVARVAAAHTIPREFADEDYVFEPSRFSDLNVPVLLLQGENSPRHLKAGTEAVHAALPDSRIAVMPGQQHVAMSTAPELFVRVITEFLFASG
ncbi:MAG TPA: alpha/beta hydrolase [Methanoculleus sp.]|nr:alpha/beta hydrolase [Methanoculleus sp.]